MVREKENQVFKDIRMKIDIDTYSRLKSEMYKRKMYTWREFFRYIAELLKDLDEEDRSLNANSSNQSLKEENQESKAKEVSDSTEQAKADNPADHYISTDA